MRRSLTIAATLVAALQSSSHLDVSFAAEEEGPAWTAVPVDASYSGWREGSRRGWSIVADAALRPTNDRRLSAVTTDAASSDSSADGAAAPEVLLSRGDSNLYTKDDYGDIELRIDFMVPRESNSGVKLNGMYEIQIRDTHGKEELTGDDCGGVYPRGENEPRYHQIDEGVGPRVNAARPAGEWQTLEIAFQAPRFDDEGHKSKNARFLRVVLNGETIHEDVELLHPTGAAWDEVTEIPAGPIMLQGDHGPVAFRRLAVRPLTLETK
jgi:hypothetical protein